MNEVYDAQSSALRRARDIPKTEEYVNNPDKLYGDRCVPQMHVKSEQPWHRLLLYFKARGLSNKECAKRLQSSEQYVGQVARQPWFRQRLVTVLREEGLPAVQEMIRGAAAESLLKIIELRDHAKKEEVQRDCAMDILDRYLGKAPTISAEGGTVAEIDERKLDGEIAELQRKINQPAALAAEEQGSN